MSLNVSPHPSPSNWFLHSGFLPRTLIEILMVTFSFLPTKSRVSVDLFLFRAGICYCGPEQNLPLEVGFVANKIANKIIVMIAYITEGSLCARMWKKIYLYYLT